VSFIPVFHGRLLEDNLMEKGHGFSIYQNVLVTWDEDYDQRVLLWIDSLKPSVRRRLYAASEAKGALCLLWRGGPIPVSLRADESLDTADDVWFIRESKIIQQADLDRLGYLVMLPACDAITKDKLIS
jgi:hypothetical protein